MASSSPAANGFRKSERLCSQALIDRLFASGRKMLVFPYSVRYIVLPSGALDEPVQVLISVSKRKFRHAVDRNRVKRLTRECYRLSKSDLYEALRAHDCSLLLAVSYIHNRLPRYSDLAVSFDKLNAKLSKAVANG